jgi:hypothetical protein
MPVAAGLSRWESSGVQSNAAKRSRLALAARRDLGKEGSRTGSNDDGATAKWGVHFGKLPDLGRHGHDCHKWRFRAHINDGGRCGVHDGVFGLIQSSS